MNRILASLLLVLTTLLGHAQGSMNIYQTNGSILQVALSSIDSVTYQLAPPPPLMRIHQTGGSILSLAVADIDSITYSTGGAAGTPQVATLPATGVGSNTAVCAGTVTSEGGSTVTSRGICYGTGALPDLSGPFVASGAGLGGFQAFLSSLQPSTLYYARAYATNSQGTAYGNAVAFVTTGNTGGTLPTVVSTQPSGVNSHSATAGGQVTSDGGNTVVARGVVWSTGPNPTLVDNFTIDGAALGSFNSVLNDLWANTAYFIRAYATNGNGTVYGGTYQINTNSPILPGLTTNQVNGITFSSATISGTVDHQGGSPVTDRGFCWSTIPNPSLNSNQGLLSSNSGLGIFFASLTGLTGNTLYYFRAYATNGVGTNYGNELTFFIPTQGIQGAGVTDIEGNSYPTAILGYREWMASNLKTSQYRNGDSIPFITGSWWGSTTERFSYFNDDASNDSLYGKLYNLAVIMDLRSICPFGWHVPSEIEWQYLEYCIGIPRIETQSGGSKGGLQNAGGQLKSPQYWELPNVGATNTSGFSAIPSGIKDAGYVDMPINQQGPNRLAAYWSSTSVNGGLVGQTAWWRALSFNSNLIIKDYENSMDGGGAQSGFSCRCVKDGQPIVYSNTTYNLSSMSIDIEYEVVDSGFSIVTQRGICWSTSSNPTLADSFINDGSGLGLFSSSLSGLTPNTNYYARSYAINSLGTSYGNVIEFTTLP